MPADVTPTSIAERVVEAILAQKLAPGERLGEQALAENFAVSRTMVREALMQLQARGFVEVQSRRGWYVVEPSADEARDAFSARRIVEAGILAESEGRPLQNVIRKLRDHIADEQRAIEAADAATRAFLLADFHVCLAEQMGHQLLVDVLRDLTARTTLAATLYQSRHEAGQSCAEHGAIVAALEAGDTARARALMIDHIGNVERSLEVDPTAEPDAPARLRATLAPVALPRARR
ncbi:DNA-binding GntR family transcriptional regulator [Variovorax paradoxus]|uniref:GntR family transcriptional regulator n=1 Tax=Variovorax paradoxus TaxID=34073 RepID=UPI00277E7A32|nr:GntR family transcriptional regulator [Variovorax paradoxus]MDP9932499.1 DNA-binding GntR family transcriptional regulator [Variovorax paradoxus]MDQ0027779.1 DNA-binding GntR family transcriptional regulator [Variovorax paradoxus]